MLQEFLNKSLLPIKDEDNFNKLKKSSNELAKRLKKKKSKISDYTIVALDPEISLDNPIVDEVRRLITGKWRTFQNNSNDSPKTFIRAVILDALDSVSKDILFASIIWYSARNIQKYLKLNGREKELINNFLLGLGEKIEEQAINDWSISRKQSYLEFEIEDLEALKLDKVALIKRFEHAAGPTNSDGEENYTSPNPHWTNSNASWSHEFAPRAANGIRIVVDKVLEEITEYQKNLKNVIREHSKEIQETFLRDTFHQQLRSQLLWWKEASYSPSLGKSYRDMNIGIFEISLVYDYSKFIPEVYPTSVDYFLVEAFESISKRENEVKISFSDFLKEIESSSMGLRELFDNPSEITSRMSLLSYIQGLVWGKYSIKQFDEIVGVSLKSKVPIKDLIIWLFHDFHVQKLKQ